MVLMLVQIGEKPRGARSEIPVERWELAMYRYRIQDKSAREVAAYLDRDHSVVIRKFQRMEEAEPGILARLQAMEAESPGSLVRRAHPIQEETPGSDKHEGD